LDIPLPVKIGITIVLVAGFWAGGAILYSYGGPLIPLLSPTLGLEITLGIGSAYTGRRERE
jgi:CHASE2 domain-containing sensor protein